MMLAEKTTKQTKNPKRSDTPNNCVKVSQKSSSISPRGTCYFANVHEFSLVLCSSFLMYYASCINTACSLLTCHNIN